MQSCDEKDVVYGPRLLHRDPASKRLMDSERFTHIGTRVPVMKLKSHEDEIRVYCLEVRMRWLWICPDIREVAHSGHTRSDSRAMERWVLLSLVCAFKNLQ